MTNVPGSCAKETAKQEAEFLAHSGCENGRVRSPSLAKNVLRLEVET